MANFRSRIFRIPITFLVTILLTGCVRPATRTSWTPIDEIVPTSPLESSSSTRMPVLITSERNDVQTSSTPLVMAIPATLADSPKGYELVGWQENRVWNFTLVTATNREKTFEELTSPGTLLSPDGYVKITVTGIEELLSVLKRLPPKEEVFWSGMDLEGQVPPGTIFFSYPDDAMLNEIIAFCNDNDINLTIFEKNK